MKEIWSKIEEIPFHPRAIKEPLGTILFSLPDIPAYIFQNVVKSFPVLPQSPPFFYPYRSGEFSKRVFEVENGLRIKTVVGERKTNKRTIILVHGIFQSKNFLFIRNIANRLYQKYGFNVIVIDIRDHLATCFLSPKFPASSGLLEGQDILEIAAQFKSNNNTSNIFLLGFSFGGSIVLNTLNTAKAKDIISGVVAVSPALILENAVKHIDTYPGFLNPFYPMFNLFQICLRLRYGLGIKTFDEYLRRAAFRYGFEKNEMIKKSSVTSFIKKIEVPTLILLSKDDSVIPAGDIEEVINLSKSQENVKVIVKGKGGHIAFSFTAQEWFYKVISTFFRTF